MYTVETWNDGLVTSHEAVASWYVVDERITRHEAHGTKVLVYNPQGNVVYESKGGVT